MLKNKEIHHEGWLIKSPPTKRLWRARWRKRWFTLKQGEIPGQFCLEYYTDRNCRKLKGVIDLDQCEQVDSGLRLEHRKQKFQYMFDIKTPRRTYYLAADTENDMRDWVNCICQVCNLHDFTKQPGERQYYNIVENTTQRRQQQQQQNENNASFSDSISSLNNSVSLPTDNNAKQTTKNVVTTVTTTTTAATTAVDTNASRVSSEITKRTNQLSLNNTYQNNDFSYVNTDYTNTETMLCDTSLLQQNAKKQCEHDILTPLKQNDNKTKGATAAAAVGAAIKNETLALKSNLLDRSQSFRDITRKNGDNDSTISGTPPILSSTASVIIPNHQRAQSLNETTSSCVTVGTDFNTLTATTKTAATTTKKKIPENLVLSNTALVETSVEPSPALSTCSGPYIPISECFSGSPKILNNDVPSTPLNSLDPKFYDTPRSHNNIGLNLTNDQSYSPKIYNCPQTQVKQRDGRSTPSDSESVFTDDEEWSHSMPLRDNVDRNLRPSDSSVENDSIVFTYTQRFSKIPDANGQTGQKSQQQKQKKSSNENAKKVSKRKNRLFLESTSDEEKLRDIPQLSDTENTSPAIGPRDSSSCVEESYDIPRSHHLPYYNMNTLHKQQSSPSATDNNPPMASSTPDLIAETELSERNSTRTLPRPHFYTNAAPTKIEGNVFRYDFIEQTDVPPVNRSLKPKLNPENKTTTPTIKDLPPKQAISTPTGMTVKDKSPPRPPSVDRKLKPAALKPQDSPILPSTLRRPGVPASFIAAASTDSEFNVNHKELETRTLPRNMSSNNNNNNISNFTKSTTFGAQSLHSMETTTTQPSNNSQLQYFDLDTSNPPPPPQINRATSSSFSQGVNIGGTSLLKFVSGTSLDTAGIQRQPIQSGVVYNSVDFLKTEAFKRIREDAEKNRMKD